MTANELYNLKPKNVTKEIYNLYKHIDILDSFCNYEANERVEVKEIISYCFDGRRVWNLSTVWFDGNPVMVIQEAGREGDDHVADYVTDKERYREMIQYLRSLEEEDDNYSFLEPDKDEPNLTSFYGHELSDFYDPDFKPKYNIGDIIEVEVPENSLSWWNSEYIKVKAEILNVYDNPYDTYRLREIERKIHYGNFRDEDDKTYIKWVKEIKENDSVKYDSIYFRVNKELEYIQH